MSKTHYTIPFGIIVFDIEHLPDDMDQDDVVNQVRDVVNAALTAWYEAGGKELVAFEPSY